jgi:hypothetical protein
MSIDATVPLDTEWVSLLPSWLRSTRAALNILETAIVAGAIPTITTIANADTSPSVLNAVALVTANAGATTITYLDDGFEGQLVIIVAGDSDTNIQHDTGLIQLTNGADVKLQDGEAILLCLEDSVWREVGGRKRLTFTTVSSATYTALVTDSAILGNAGATAILISLPLGSTVPEGHEVKVKKIDSTANEVTVSRSGSDFIDTGTTEVLTLQGESATFVWNGVDTWWKFN